MADGQIFRLREIIKNSPEILWYCGNFDALDELAIAEAVYNYGSWEDVGKMHEILGFGKAKELFNRLQEQKRCNLKPIVANYFRLYYGQYAQ